LPERRPTGLGFLVGALFSNRNPAARRPFATIEGAPFKVRAAARLAAFSFRTDPSLRTPSPHCPKRTF
jgi:hypothetical protein